MKKGAANCAVRPKHHGLVNPRGVAPGLEGLRRDSSASESDVSEDEESSQSSNLELRLAPSATCAVVTGFPSTAAVFALGGEGAGSRKSVSIVGPVFAGSFPVPGDFRAFSPAGDPPCCGDFPFAGDFLRPSTTGAGVGFGSGERGSAGTSSNDDRSVKPNPPPDAAGGGPIENPKPPPPSGGGIASSSPGGVRPPLDKLSKSSRSRETGKSVGASSLLRSRASSRRPGLACAADFSLTSTPRAASSRTLR